MFSINVSIHQQPSHYIPQDGSVPISAIIQEGFMYSCFHITHSVLINISLATSDSCPDCIEMYQSNYGFWLKIPLDHVIMVNKVSVIFLCTPGVETCPSFEDLSGESLHPIGNLQTNLASERQEAQKKIYEHVSSTPHTCKQWRSMDSDNEEDAIPRYRATRPPRHEDMVLGSDNDCSAMSAITPVSAVHNEPKQ
ncbi:hypothetical protein EDD85DRAFT_943773 [Armillaria nabsnona]|nr:hypothetical protein EDD85DRAFT_943773 [Armillaria nabsnona]